jgi:hypothetical protein
VHDTLEILRTWSALVPPERVHVIIVPPRGSAPDRLWDRFAGVVGVDPRAADTGRARSNASLGLAEVEVLRRLNTALSDDVPGWFYMRNVKDALAHGALAARPSSLGRLELPPEREKWAREHADGVITELRATRYDIVGDLGDLSPRPVTGAGARPSDAGAEEMLDAAIAAVTALLGELAKTQGVTRPAQSGPDRPSRLKGRLIELSQRNSALHRLRRGYWHVANAARHLRATARPGPSRGGD